MEEFFASLYEWFGLNPLYSTDMGDHLRGWMCIDQSGYYGTNWYIIIGWSMIAITAFFLCFAVSYYR